MILREELEAYLHELLACATIDDYAPNGVQIEGTGQIQRICTAVTASLEAINQAISLQADALLVHHGYFWRGETPLIKGTKRERIAKLINHDLNLFAYHLPLDCHTELGNNACLAKLFNLESINQHQVGKTANLLWSGSFAKPISAEDFATLIKEKLQRSPLHVSGTEKPIHRLAWCSGAAQDFIEQADALGVDAYLSGEISERTYYQAKELGIHYFACGHHATERYGIQALGNHLANKYSLEHYFIDSSNPV
ncbi:MULTISPECIES: Nif3-like dinuclear metal center hexameric protein [Legionella]|uniref:Putative NIF3-like protein 1 n=1 Tax=Legionella drozanskii LLAP-1 TaxID=1212489 RepID=A0A0W0SQL6_9GAMM|nr:MULTISPECIES: Nif3-like dinuclear metal center hexameric protein [Legionella]KTC85598.1 putative NIF3-like protein 1 [Legionella drozanskii LLAP-1]PJE16172.1 MAG: Nif3-like dinuclear metal center hexameric protein [Legionella sp.]